MCIMFSIFRTLNCMIGQMKHILAAEQKKTDFKPEDENNVLIQYTNVSGTIQCANILSSSLILIHSLVHLLVLF